MNPRFGANQLQNLVAKAGIRRRNDLIFCYYFSKVMIYFYSLYKKNWLLVSGALLLLLAAVSYALYVRYSFEIYPVVNFNSDDAVSLLFSNEMLKQHTLLPTWYSSTGLAWPFSKPESMILPLFLEFSSHWMACFRVAVAVDQLLMSVLVWWILGRAGLSRGLRLFFFCVLFASLSSRMAEQTVMIGGQIWFYAKMLLMSFLVFHCAYKSSSGGDQKAWRWFVAVFLVGAWLFVDASYISRMIPPLCAALAMLWVVWAGRRPSKAIVSVAGVLALAAISGMLVFNYLIPATTSYHLYSNKFVDINAAGANFLLFLQGLMDLFGASPPAGTGIYSISSIFWIVKLAILCITLLGPIWLLTQWRRLKSDFLRFLVIVFVGSFGLRALVYIFTGISVGSVATNRYFISVAFLGMTIMLLYFDKHWRALPLRLGSLATAVLLIAGSPLLVAKPTSQSTYQRLAQYLDAHDLEFGYATYWNAGVVTALSDDRVRIRQVTLRNGYVGPFRWLSSPRWYQGNLNNHQSFLLLKGTERKFNMSGLTPVLGKPIQTVNIGDYRAIVYPFDIAARLGWKLSVDEHLPAADRRASIQSTDAPVWSVKNHSWVIEVRVTNLGALPIGSNGSWPVNLGVHLLSANGHLLDNDYARAALPMIQPGKSTTLMFETPNDRANGKILEFDVVQENVAWFSGAGNHTLRVRVPQPPVHAGS
jgi:hypothetical protein